MSLFVNIVIIRKTGINVDIRFASDAHRPEDVGTNILKMQMMI